MMLALTPFMDVCAQTAKEIYTEAKVLYDAKKYEQAVPKLKVAAEKGNKKAQYRLGRCYEKGHGVEKNMATAIQWYQKSVKQDYSKAQYRLGKCYMKGKGMAADEKKARSLLKKAISNPKGGDEILAKIKEEAATGDEDAKQILRLIGK